MGRIKTTLIKRIGRELYEKHAGELTEDYAQNKEILSKFIEIKSKKLKNIVAGYVTNLKKQKTA
jgi:small subunit ribosomal protein S17e